MLVNQLGLMNNALLQQDDLASVISSHASLNQSVELNSVTLIQEDVEVSSSLINQIGADNTADIEQGVVGAGDVISEQFGMMNNANILQSDAPFSSAITNQVGVDNSITAMQSGSGQTALAIQTGFTHVRIIYQ
ncbi:hypothetical protein BTJ40_14605 [Microbulbifer sp. A4B17]|uniref:hypothetical protein n=1 Tax=Microbulbifer sp. A4B17 TaxID=359370 RepID=UPI000D52D2F0|nr:hypothetical protein [Microbulbifer sp. A4B17]AWF81956.1 hypothetical protein BTJ40_14605 [Microbulbifer sp. A4B17]